jgi:hypothetical protein
MEAQEEFLVTISKRQSEEGRFRREFFLDWSICFDESGRKEVICV